MDFIVSIIKNNKKLATLGARNFCYDDIYYHYLIELINILEKSSDVVETLSKVDDLLPYFKNINCETHFILDLDNKVLSVDPIVLLTKEELLEDYGMQIIANGNEELAINDFKEESKVYKTCFEHCELFDKKEISFKELQIVNEFFDTFVINEEIEIVKVNDYKYLKVNRS